jgi:NADPH-dependent glutamate synthase beta subunit-like oxidoreductase/formate hydrogenlyase subunit 6/NADH:ubiquinone oxidoreductase subunit I
MAVTFKHLFRQPITTQYPEQRLVVSRRIRGNVLAWSREKCVGCYTCARSCPHGCIEITTSDMGKKGLIPAPCTQACPAHVDAARYIRCLAQGKPDEAVAVIRERIPFPSVCGYICAHPCESSCNRGLIDEPIAIRMLKRFAVDNDTGIWRQRSKIAPPSGKQVAVIGSGPAGLTAAYYLAKLGGHSVTVFEALPQPGGMMRYGIPEYRLPDRILSDNIKEIENVGVRIKTNTWVDNPESLLGQGFNAVFIAIGAHQAIEMGIEGEDNPGVLGGIDLLREVKLGRQVELGNRVAVIGGGNSAIDSAGTALRLRAKEVGIIYRRTRSEMPASPEEVEEALDEGVKFLFLVAPTKVISHNDELKLECIRMKLGAEDASGRRRPEPIQGSEFVIELDNIIAAIGQKPRLPEAFGLATGRGNTIQVNPDTLATGREGIFAGGDAVLGPATVIQAIAAGRQAAISIDKYLGGSGTIDETLALPEEAVDRAGGPGEGWRPEKYAISHQRRLNSFDVVELGWDKESALRETGRCLRCDLAYEVEKYQLNGGVCIYCGLCVEACPFDALFMGYSYERATYRLSEQTLNKEDLLTPEKRKPSGYARPEVEKTLPEQTLLIDRDL